MSLQVAVILLLLESTWALVPHSFWNPKRASKPCSIKSRRNHGLCMYFDDCERREIEDWENSSASWSLPFSEEKKKALARHLGYNYESAINVSDDQIEDETLVWAVETDVVWTDESDPNACKFRSISDLNVASDCSTVVDSMALIWTELDKLFQTGSTSQEGDSVYMIVFPKVKDLWEYECMVTMLQSIEICKKLLPSSPDLRISLFHPSYKHAPKMWSPQSHSPFPTIGIQLVQKKDKYEEEQNIDEVRKQLTNLFDSVDAVRSDASRTQRITLDTARDDILKDEETQKAIKMKGEVEYFIELKKEPIEIYKSLWTAIKILHSTKSHESCIFVAPFLDAHTTHRVAVTVNAALRRFDSGMQIEHVGHPENRNRKLRSPHPIINIVKKTAGPIWKNDL